MRRTMSGAVRKARQIAARKNHEGNSGHEGGPGAGESRLPVRLDFAEASDDSLAGWLEAYFAVEVTTAASSRAVQRRDLTRFVRFMQAEEGSDERSLWTSRLSRAFLDALRNEVDEEGKRRFSDRTIARIAAHLKTFAKWIHSLRPFRLGNPTEKLKTVLSGPGLEIERALTERERRKLLDAADHLPVLGGRSRDRRRCKNTEFADERPRRKGYRPWRNRAIVSHRDRHAPRRRLQPRPLRDRL
jgi:hypothetical protein